MKKAVTVAVCSFIVIVIILGSIICYVANSPEYALAMICAEMKESGFDAVLPHLTDAAYGKVEPIIRISNNRLVQSVMSLFSANEYASVLIDKASNINWSIGDVLKNHRKASVTIEFNYNDTIIGAIDIELLKIDSNWRINDLYNLTFEKFLGD